MIAMINRFGHLKLERDGVFVAQYCPYSPEGAECGDWCPLFGEPIKAMEGNSSMLPICTKVLRLTGFEVQPRKEKI